MFRGLQNDESKPTKKAVKPLLKLGYKDANNLKKAIFKAKKTSGESVTPKKNKSKPYPTIAVQGKIEDFCNLIEVGDLEKHRLTEYVTQLQIKTAGIDLNAWSTSQLSKANLLRFPNSKPEKSGRGKKRNGDLENDCTIFYYILTIVINTDTSKTSKDAKRKSTVTLSVSSVPEDVSLKKLMAEFIIFRLWLVVRYVFTTTHRLFTDHPNMLVPIFLVKIDGRTTLGKMIKDQLSNSFRKEVRDLTRTFRCSFMWH